jgi:predicted nucleic-acid-binding Zn-ribbon protein
LNLSASGAGISKVIFMQYPRHHTTTCRPCKPFTKLTDNSETNWCNRQHFFRAAAEAIGAFYNPEEGLESSLYFNAILSGLRKKGTGLSPEERDVLRRFVTSAALSPAFLHRLVRDHGAESFVETFIWATCRQSGR